MRETALERPYGQARYVAECLSSYTETALWADGHEEALGEEYNSIASETIERFEQDVQKFVGDNWQLLQNIKPASAGHDFWLTRNSHGAGFWDGDYPKEVGDALTTAAALFGPCDLYVGDDGRLYAEAAQHRPTQAAE